MRKGPWIVGVLAVGASSVMVAAQDGQPGGMKMPSAEEFKAMMDKWQKASSPGEPHKKLAEFAGEWDLVFKVYMGGPGSPPSETKGTSKVTSVLGGRFIQEVVKGEMNMPDGMSGAMKTIPFEGIGMTGYDNFRNQYVGHWTDNLNTFMLRMSGTADPAGKVITMYGEMDEAMLDMVGRMVKYVTRIVDKDKHIFEIYDLAAGDNYKVLEVTYTRKK